MARLEKDAVLHYVEWDVLYFALKLIQFVPFRVCKLLFYQQLYFQSNTMIIMIIEQTSIHLSYIYVLAAMDGYRVVRIDDVVENVDMFVTCTGNKKVILRQHMNKMRNGSIVCNMGHSDNEVDVLSLKTTDLTWEKVISLI